MKLSTARRRAPSLLVAVLLFLLGGTSLAQEQWHWLQRMNSALDRIDRGEGGEQRVRELLLGAEGSLEDGKDPAWALYKGARALADRARDAGAVDDEIELLEKAHRAAIVMESISNQANVALRLSRLLVPRGELARCRQLLEGALSGLSLDDTRRFETLAALAQIAAFGGDWDRALDLLDRAEEAIAEDAAADEKKARVRSRRGQVFLDMGLLDRAATSLTAALDLARDHGDDPEWLHTRAALDIYLANLRLATESDDLLEREVRAVLDEDRYRELPSVRRSLELRLAMGLLDRAVEDKERLREVESLLRGVLEDESSLATDRSTARLWLVAALLDGGEIEEASRLLEGVLDEETPLVTLEEPLARALRATLVARLALERDPSSATAQAALLDVVPVYEALVSRWEATRPREGGFGFLRYTRARDILGEVVRLQLLAEAGEEGVTRALSQVIRAQGSGSLTRQLGRTTARVSEIRELLTEGECLLVVLPCSRTSTLFLVSHRDVLAFELPPRDRIADALRDFLRSFLGPDGATESARARAVVLTDALLPDAVRPHLLLHPRLTVVGLDLLGYVPFECLILDDGVPLGLGKEIAYLPSIPAGLALLERAARHPGPPPERDALFVVAPLPGEKIRERFPSLVRLPWDGSLARRLASAYGSAEILTDGAATLDGLAAALGVPSRVLQILSHGVQLPEQEIPAALVLGSTDRDDGLLGAAELRRLVMPPFVLLTACSAGAGPSRPGDAGSSDLGGVLLARGAQAVILPRTDLDFADAIDLSAMVHEAIATGETPAAALLRARQELDRRGSLEYPYSLSLLHVHGLGHIPVFPEGRVEGSSPVLLAVLAALAALVLVPVLILRRRVSASRG